MEVWCVVLIACIVSQARAGGDKLSECTSQSTVELSCPVSYVIRVLEKLVICCSQEEDCSAASSCVHRLPPSELCPSCNGRQLCNEPVLVSQDAFCPEHLLPRYFQVNYTCLSITQTSNMCGDDIETPALHYLATPDFPGQVLPVSRPLCRCRVQGESIAVTAVQIDLPFDGSALTLTDVNTSTPLWTSTHGQTASLYNTLLHSRQGLQTLDITFSPSLDRVQTAWIEIKASSLLQIGCGFRASFTTPLALKTAPISGTSAPWAPSTLTFTSLLPQSPSTATNRAKHCRVVRNQCARQQISRTDSNEGSAATYVCMALCPPFLAAVFFSTGIFVFAHRKRIRRQLRRSPARSGVRGVQWDFSNHGAAAQRINAYNVDYVNYAHGVGERADEPERSPSGSGCGGERDFPSNGAAQHFNSYVDYVNHTRGAWERADDQQRSPPGSGGDPEADVPSNEDARIFREPEPDYPRDAGVHIFNADSVAYVNNAYGAGEITAQ